MLRIAASEQFVPDNYINVIASIVRYSIVGHVGRVIYQYCGILCTLPLIHWINTVTTFRNKLSSELQQLCLYG